MYKITLLDKISLVLVLLGSLNWGAIGILAINPISIFLGNSFILQRIIYTLIFVATLNLLYSVIKSTFSPQNM